MSDPHLSSAGVRVEALLKEIERAERASVSLELETVELSAHNLGCMTAELSDLLRGESVRPEMVENLRSAAQRYSHIIHGSLQLIGTMNRVLESGGRASLCEL